MIGLGWLAADDAEESLPALAPHSAFLLVGIVVCFWL